MYPFSQGLLGSINRVFTPSRLRRFRALAIINDYSRECPAIEVDTSLGGRRVVGVLEKLSEIRGLPEVIIESVSASRGAPN